MNAGQIVTLILQGVLVIGYVVGTIIIKNHQDEKIEALETGIKTQSTIMESMQRFMGLFDLDRVEKYVKISEKTFQAEKEEALKKLDEDWKKRADMSSAFLRAEWREIMTLSLNLIWSFPYSPTVEKSINEVKSVVSKDFLLETMNNARKAYDGTYIDIPGLLGALMQSFKGGAPKKE